MNEETKTSDCCKSCFKRGRHVNTTSGIYCLAFIGAAIYYLQHSATFWAGVLGILKALVWPAMLIYKLLEFLKM